MAFRYPVYLDQDLLVPLANYHGIDVMREVSVMERNTGGSEMGGELAIAKIGARATRAKGSEVTRSEVIHDHPVSALNRLVDALKEQDALVLDLDDGVSKDDTVELDLECELSPLSDVGAMVALLFRMATQNPGALDSTAVPAEFIALALNGSPTGTAVLEGRSGVYRVLVMIDGGNLIGEGALDRIEGGAVVLGQVERLVPEGRFYSLQPLLTPGLNRGMRRAFGEDAINDLLGKVKPLVGREMSTEDLKVSGPALVVRALAIY